MTTKPTTIDGCEVLWHAVVRNRSILNDDPDEVAVTTLDAKVGGVLIWGLYHGQWQCNTGHRAAVRMLLDEVERLNAVIDCMDRKQRHGCYDANCKECDQ